MGSSTRSAPTTSGPATPQRGSRRSGETGQRTGSGAATFPPRFSNPAGSSPSGGFLLLPLLLHRLHVQLDPDVVTDEDAARLERLVPAQAPVPAVDLGGRGEARALAAPRILAHSLEDRVERDLHGRVADGEVADDAEARALLVKRTLNALAAERDRRVALHIEEVLRTQVLVPILDAGVDARRVDLDFGRRVFRRVLVHRDGAAERLEAAAHRREHHVLDRELDARVRGVDLP